VRLIVVGGIIATFFIKNHSVTDDVAFFTLSTLLQGFHCKHLFCPH
jgi:hypothetical protein